MTYKDAGVDIDAGNEFVNKIKDITKNNNIGNFGSAFDLKSAGYVDPILVSSTDGVGTKLEIARQMNQYYNLGIDLVAMNVNDILTQGAMPLFFLDYISTSKISDWISLEIIKGIVDGCNQSGCSLIGGETSESSISINGIYDLAGFCVGAVERENKIDFNNTKDGDVVIAIASSGIHANGYSLVRKIIDEQKIDLKDSTPFKTEEKTFGEYLLRPTTIYANAIRGVLEAVDYDTKKIHGISHITGGGLIDNPPRSFHKDLKITIDFNTWDFPNIFYWLKRITNIDIYEFARIFNCGIGMLIYVSPEYEKIIVDTINNLNYEAFCIGKLFNKEKDEKSVNLLNFSL